MSVAAIIPARYQSTRLPGKPLADINGQTLLQRVWKNVSSARTIDEVVIATDDERIARHCQEIGAVFTMTDPELPSGTDRIMQAYSLLGLNADIVVNVQGDEPMLTADVLDQLINTFTGSGADVGTLISKITEADELNDPGTVKVVSASDMTALYFSRATIPYQRDIDTAEWLKKYDFYKHIGVYAYSIESLKRFTELPQAPLEKAEKLEQLRLMTDGARYLCVETDVKLLGVDTPEDLDKARALLI